jgi:outer membrane protein, multidrug efflux system
MKNKAALLGAAALLAGCTVGPTYHRPAPAVPLPPDWHWQAAQPSDDLPKGPWWKLFNDDELNRLEDAATAQNQDLKAAMARVDEARARARLQGASFFPTANLEPSYSRVQLPKDNPQFAKIPIQGILQRYEPYNSYTVPLDLSYEVDLWGRVRRSFEASQAEAQASLADYQNVLLTAESDVAVDYLTLREYDAEVMILQDTVTARSESVRINKVRVQAGRATNVDVAQAETDLTNAEASLADVDQRRAETQDALAVLCGVNPSDQILSPRPLEVDAPPPIVPVGLPASLLERRPDIAEAERTMQAQNAAIGVAYAAFFPRVTLTGQGGYMSARATDLFTWPNTIWSYGPQVSLPIFDGGQNLSNLQAARANYKEAVARYRSTVLSSVRDVEDALADLRFLAQENEALRQSVLSARQATDLEKKRFLVGETNYTDVIVADETRLATERNRAQVRGQQFYATVRLIKALGGGWDAHALDVEKPAPYPFNMQAKLPGANVPSLSGDPSSLVPGAQ